MDLSPFSIGLEELFTAGIIDVGTEVFSVEFFSTVLHCENEKTVRLRKKMSVIFLDNIEPY
ncbi:hypothetical protein GCM10022259_39350 [Aquimarina mytili]